MTSKCKLSKDQWEFVLSVKLGHIPRSSVSMLQRKLADSTDVIDLRRYIKSAEN